MRWIKASDLESWSNSLDCRGTLSRVIRKLIHATLPIRDIKINFPSDESIDKRGYDGKLETLVGNEYIQEGLSVWEFSCSEKIKTKANRDYKNRSKNPLEINQIETIFVFATSRKFPNKELWVKDRKDEGIWKDVRVIDAVTLEDWLEQAPAVGAWFAQQHLGIFPKEATALDAWWEYWRKYTKPYLIPEIVLADRNEAIQNVRDWLHGQPTQMSVIGETENEAIAFLASTIIALPENDREIIFSKILVVENSEAFKHIIYCKNNLILIMNFEDLEGINPAIERGHHIFVPLGSNRKTRQNEIILPRLGREEFISALQRMGFSETEANKISRDTARSLAVLRRYLANVKTLPDWAKSDSARDIIPSLLVGRWLKSKPNDKNIVSQIAEETYESYSKKIVKWKNEKDSPLKEIGNLWRLVSPLDAWLTISSYLTESDLEQIKKVSLKVLSEINPVIELKPEERFVAPIYDKEPIYSDELRKGVSQTLILMAVHGNNLNNTLAISSQIWIDNLVRELLKDADWKLWYSLSDVLPLIAEASPLSFLDAVDASLSQSDPPILGMFCETKDPLTSPTKHTGLLWALEGLAWSTQFFGRVTQILGKLAILDPYKDSLHSNRPKNSLHSIFLLWNPQTFATLEKRLEALDVLTNQQPELGWNLLVSLILHSHEFLFHSHKMRWRQLTEETEKKPTFQEIYKGVISITERLIQNVGNNGMRWVSILDRLTDIPPEQSKILIKKLKNEIDEIVENRKDVQIKIRNVISQHKSFPDSEWSLTKDEIDELEYIYSSLEPKDIVDRFLWLFDEQRPKLLEGKELDYKEHNKKVEKYRCDAVRSIKQEKNLEGLLQLIDITKNPWIVGFAVADAKIIETEEEQILFSFLGKVSNKLEFIDRYIFRCSMNQGKEYIKKLVDLATKQKWSDKKVINLFVSLPAQRNVWDLLESFNESINRKYWRNCIISPFGHKKKHSKEDKIYILEKLIRAKRFQYAMNMVCFWKKETPSNLIVKLLKKLATEETQEEDIIHHYEIDELFEVLDKSDDVENSDLAHLEYLYLNVLTAPSCKRPPKFLHKKLSEDPICFADIIEDYSKGFIDDPKNFVNSCEEKIGIIKLKAKLAFNLFHSWKLVPGTTNDNKIDCLKLKEWVDKARDLCKKTGRKEVCDDRIGKILAHSISEIDGEWPPEAVCKIIQEIYSEDLNNGFNCEVFDKRGVYGKALFEGGKQERELAQRFRDFAKRWYTKYPRVAALLNKIANEYEERARREDDRSEKLDLEY